MGNDTATRRGVGTIRWADGKFFFEHLNGGVEPTVRPHGWYSEAAEKRVLSALKRKGYKFDGSPQLWKGYIGANGWVVPLSGGVENDDWHMVGGDTLVEVLASIKALPACSPIEKNTKLNAETE